MFPVLKKPTPTVRPAGHDVSIDRIYNAELELGCGCVGEEGSLRSFAGECLSLPLTCEWTGKSVSTM